MHYYIWVLFTIILLILFQGNLDQKNYIYHACRNHKLQRNLLTLDQILNNLENSLESINNIDFDILKFYKNFEFYVSEYTVNLIIMKSEIKEPFVKLKFNTKIIQTIKEYEKCFDEYNDYVISLIQKIVDVMLETDIYLYETLTDFNNILSYEPYWKEAFQRYCIKNDKVFINKESMLLNLEITEKFYNLLKNINNLNE